MPVSLHSESPRRRRTQSKPNGVGGRCDQYECDEKASATYWSVWDMERDRPHLTYNVRK